MVGKAVGARLDDEAGKVARCGSTVKGFRQCLKTSQVSENMRQKRTLRASTARVTLAGENGVSTVGTEVDGRDAVLARGSANGGVKWGSKRGVFRWGYPQHFCLKDNDRRERESRSREIRTLDRVEGGGR